MHRVLVTGGAGYIGSHCCKALAEAGFQPVVFDDLHTGHESFVRWGPFIKGDVRDGAALRAALRQAEPAAVVHFAALALVGESTAHPERYWGVNVGGTLQLLEAMREASVGRLVFSSTCAVYGEPAKQPIDESFPRQPINPYGATKHACERMMEDFDGAHGLRSVRLRYFNAAGADPAGMIGEWHEPETHLIPLILDAAAGLRPAIEVYGSDYPTPDGTAVRDYIHVADLAAAHVAAVHYLLAGGASAALNLGTGHGTSVAEAVAAVETVTGRSVPVKHVPRRAGDPAVLLADPRRAEALLGWRAERDLHAIVEDAWRWHRQLAAVAGRRGFGTTAAAKRA
jgi:UDP-glucose-4-epimerase GalE